MTTFSHVEAKIRTKKYSIWKDDIWDNKYKSIRSVKNMNQHFKSYENFCTQLHYWDWGQYVKGPTAFYKPLGPRILDWGNGISNVFKSLSFNLLSQAFIKMNWKESKENRSPVL